MTAKYISIHKKTHRDKTDVSIHQIGSTPEFLCAYACIHIASYKLSEAAFLLQKKSSMGIQCAHLPSLNMTWSERTKAGGAIIPIYLRRKAVLVFAICFTTPRRTE